MLFEFCLVFVMILLLVLILRFCVLGYRRRLKMKRYMIELERELIDKELRSYYNKQKIKLNEDFNQSLISRFSNFMIQFTDLYRLCFREINR